jgi:DNA-binding transcriptional ArsR family regulator
MPDELLSSAYRVRNPRAAAAFSNPLRRRLLLLSASRERSLSELASTTGIELKSLHYHVGALAKLGLIIVSGCRARAGRPIKLYRAVAEAFFIPLDVMDTSPSAAMTGELRDARARLADPAREGTLYRVSEGKFHMQPIGNSGKRQSPTADCWRMLQLSSTEALRLAADMDACLKAAAERSRGATKAYLVHFAFAPRLRQ